MKIPSPFIPLRVSSEDLSHTVDVVGRSYTFGADGMISQITTQGHELLAEPMRLVMEEDGKKAVFDNNYPENESESFIQNRSDEKAVICGCKQTERFIINFCNTVEYDGNIDIDFKLMTRGLTVAQVFGIGDMEPLQFKLDKLWLEVPLKKEFCSLYHMYLNSDMYFDDGTVKEKSLKSMSGKLPDKSFSLPFKPILWLGNEEYGLGWFAENDRYWQSENENKAIEVIHAEDKVILRIRLLDSQPRRWSGDATKGYDTFRPLDFHFGFQATPVKPFPKNPYLHNAFHIDCGIKIKGNYIDFLKEENRYDRLKEKGVTTLILHEKWNKSQNWFELSEFTANQLRVIVDECHKRGIKVLPYFGYEISTMSPEWSNFKDDASSIMDNGSVEGGWWRVPFQRDYITCYNSSYADYMVEGIAKLIDEYNLDGIYLDSTAQPKLCHNTEHGCGWYDDDGNLRGSYTIKAIRRLFKRLYAVVKARCGMINVHTYGVVNYTALPYIDQNWYGENLQMELMKGSTKDIDLDYFRTEYSGRNMGVPVEFIAYENRPLWNFENALSCSILHGILPRPNDIEYPLELMSGVWKVFDNFPIEKSEWMPYWTNNVKSSHEKVKVSYYKYTSLGGEEQLLAFVVNISASEVENVTLEFEENCSKVTDMTEETDCGFSFGMKPYSYKILFIR